MRRRLDAASSGRMGLGRHWRGALVLPMILAAPAAASADVTLGTTSSRATPLRGVLRRGDRSAHERSDHPLHGLKGIPGGFARRVLGLLGGTVGKVSTAHSRVAKGHVVKTVPGAGTYTAGRVVGSRSHRSPSRRRSRRARSDQISRSADRRTALT
jgi:hypothetical protein